MTGLTQMIMAGAVLLASSWVLPGEASAANCNFNRNEKIAMVSWIIPIAGAVITPMACRRDMFNKKNKGASARPDSENGRRRDAYVHRRRRHSA